MQKSARDVKSTKFESLAIQTMQWQKEKWWTEIYKINTQITKDCVTGTPINTGVNWYDWNSMRSKSVSQRYFFMIIILIYHDCDFKKMRIQKLLNRVEKYRWIFLWTTRQKNDEQRSTK
jgi:hypothetical protein